jgi:hypothetical protein
MIFTEDVFPDKIQFVLMGGWLVPGEIGYVCGLKADLFRAHGSLVWFAIFQASKLSNVIRRDHGAIPSVDGYLLDSAIGRGPAAIFLYPSTAFIVVCRN